MKLIDTITVRHLGTERSINLYVGDLAAVPVREAVDVLVVSAFPNDYLATPHSLIGALERRGVSVAQLAEDKEIDLRAFSSCWLSRPVRTPGVNFGRILCFEPYFRGHATDVVGDIFRSIVPITGGTPSISTIAIPLVASGDQNAPAEAMLESLVDAAANWLCTGLTLNCIKVVLHDSADTASLRETFARVKRRHMEAEPAPKSHAFAFDVFMSYSHKDKSATDTLVAGLKARRPSLRIFLDRHELRLGAAWQQHIFESLDASSKVICVLSPDYIASKVCKEEFNIALMRHRETDTGVLLPLYLRSADLPGYIRLLQYEDAREGDLMRITEASEKLASLL